MGDQISADRQAELQRYIDRWQADAEHGERRGPFDRVALTGADVYWIAEQSGRDEQRYVPNLHLAGAHLLDKADLQGARLEGSTLSDATLEVADLR